MNIEKKRVESCSQSAHYSEGVMKFTTAYCGEIFRKYMKKGSVLELGPAEGVMTDRLYPYFEDYTIVDGVDSFVKSIKDRYPAIKGYHCLFEEFIPEQQYDNIILGHVLEHVKEPCKILKNCSSWLTSGGGNSCSSSQFKQYT